MLFSGMMIQLDALLESDAGHETVTSCQFWCRLYKMGQYKELAKLAILVLTLSSDTVECERGFSCMKMSFVPC